MDQEAIKRLAAKKFAIGVNVGRKKERESKRFDKKKRKRDKWYRTHIIVSIAASTIVLKAIEILWWQIQR
jgi:hypothetical protein